MSNIAYRINTEENSQCRRDNLKRTTEILIPLVENYLDTVDFSEYTKEEFNKFLEDFKNGIPFEFEIRHESYGSAGVPNDEIWLIIHNRVDHHCRIELKINSIFRNNKINDLLGD